MKRFFAVFRKYWKLYGVFVRNSIMSQMEYRTNFFMSALVQLAHMLTKLTYVLVIYKVDQPINGITPDEMLIMIGTYSALSGVFVSFFLFNFDGLSGQIQRGSLDSNIVKPVSLQFISTLQHVDLAFATVSVLAGGIMIATGWYRAGIAVTPVKLLGFLLFTISGIFLTYSIFLIPNILCFWTIRSRGISDVVGKLWDFNNMPMTIYSGVIKLLGTFIIPVFLITNIGGLFVVDKLEPWLLVWSLVAPILFFALSCLLWKQGMKRYVSVSG